MFTGVCKWWRQGKYSTRLLRLPRGISFLQLQETRTVQYSPTVVFFTKAPVHCSAVWYLNWDSFLNLLNHCTIHANTHDTTEIQNTGTLNTHQNQNTIIQYDPIRSNTIQYYSTQYYPILTVRGLQETYTSKPTQCVSNTWKVQRFTSRMAWSLWKWRNYTLAEMEPRKIGYLTWI